MRLDLNTISKTIAGLLSLPLSTVGTRLRELRTAQDQKVSEVKIVSDAKTEGRFVPVFSCMEFVACLWFFLRLERFVPDFSCMVC